MQDQQLYNYERIEKAIIFLRNNFTLQPSLEEIAAQSGMSAFHFQRMFTEWAGISPKKFLQYLSVEHAKKILQAGKNISDATHETGLSGTGRLHDLFISIEGMTPGEYKNSGAELTITHSSAETPFGKLLIASTEKGICCMAFSQSDEQKDFEALKSKFANAKFIESKNTLHENALAIFHSDWNNIERIKLHLRGTAFQLKVWETLLKIPYGKLASYSTLAQMTGNEKAARAVGTAVGSNPVAYLIPCHRVIQQTGIIGNYRWGADRKTAIIGYELSKTSEENN
jgi:AraC family transcriptional regulator, regulatory protein of adaptative response / methylated-DNA-[protein]-cysteine methyltransferase